MPSLDYLTMKYSDLIHHILYGDHPNIEPVKSIRLRSVRELKYGPHYISHRFPFKGGISFRDTVIENVVKNNALLARLRLKRKDTKNA